MKHKVFLVLLASVLLLSACGSLPAPTATKVSQPTQEPKPTQPPVPGGAALAITGLVDQKQSLTMEQLKAMDVVTVQVEHPKKGPQTGEGVRLNALLDLAQVKQEATTIVLVASDGFTAEVALADVRACQDCLIAFNQEGNLKSMMPGQPGNAWVKGVVKIEVK